MAESLQKKPIRVVQVSDCHLFKSVDGKLLGLNTEDSVDLVLDLVRQEQASIDLLLATGDLSQDGSKESYQRLYDKLSTFNVPQYWLEGNHDTPMPMQAVLGDVSLMSPCIIREGGWALIMLDSSIPGEVPGEFFDEDLSFLAQALEETKGCHVMVCLHHHPIPLGCAWLDTQVVANADAFFDLVDQYDHLKAIMWGHVHQSYAGERNGVKLFAVPSTCVQFKPHSDDFAVDTAAPGYRWFDLHENGEVESSVSRIEGVVFEVDLSVKGY